MPGYPSFPGLYLRGSFMGIGHAIIFSIISGSLATGNWSYFLFGRTSFLKLALLQFTHSCCQSRRGLFTPPFHVFPTVTQKFPQLTSWDVPSLWGTSAEKALFNLLVILLYFIFHFLHMCFHSCDSCMCWAMHRVCISHTVSCAP